MAKIKMIKIALSFPINYFSKIYSLRSYHTYSIVNATYKGNCFEFESSKPLIVLLPNCTQRLTIFYD